MPIYAARVHNPTARILVDPPAEINKRMKSHIYPAPFGRGDTAENQQGSTLIHPLATITASISLHKNISREHYDTRCKQATGFRYLRGTPVARSHPSSTQACHHARHDVNAADRREGDRSGIMPDKLGLGIRVSPQQTCHGSGSSRV